MFRNHVEQFTLSDSRTTGEGLGLQFFEMKLQFINLIYLQKKFVIIQINIYEKWKLPTVFFIVAVLKCFSVSSHFLCFL